LGFDGSPPIQLLNNHHLDPEESDVTEYREIITVDWSPDGSALSLLISYWEYADLLWMEAIDADPAENNLHNPDGLWRDGYWTRNGEAIVLSGWSQGNFSDLGLLWKESGQVEQLIDGEAAGMAISKAQEYPNGIIFLAWETDLENGTGRYRLHLGQIGPDGFVYSPAGPDRDLCPLNYVADMAWDPAGVLAVISCDRDIRLISLDGRNDVDLTPFMEPLLGNNSVKVFWGRE
jgi:hypothetical protein